MIPQNQMTFGEGTGNCFAACLASISELPVDQLPVPDPTKEEWAAYFPRLLKRVFDMTGLVYFEVAVRPGVEIGGMAGTWVVATGDSIHRPCKHCVVGRIAEDGKIGVVHCPCGDAGCRGIKEPEMVGILMAYGKGSAKL